MKSPSRCCGAIVVAITGLALAQGPTSPLATFSVGRVRYSRNDGRDCGDVGRSMASLVAQVSTVPVHNERKVALLEPALFEMPFLFMNGHNDFVLSDTELENLRTYFDHGGFLFASGCCTNPAFPAAWRREFSRVFPNEASSRCLRPPHLPIVLSCGACAELAPKPRRASGGPLLQGPDRGRDVRRRPVLCVLPWGIAATSAAA